MKPTPREVAAAHRLGEAILETLLALEEGGARRRSDRPRPEIHMKVKVNRPPALKKTEPAPAPIQVVNSTPAPAAASRPTPHAGLLSMKDAAAWLSVSQRTLWRLVAMEEVRCVRIGRSARIPMKELERYVGQPTSGTPRAR